MAGTIVPRHAQSQTKQSETLWTLRGAGNPGPVIMCAQTLRRSVKGVRAFTEFDYILTRMLINVLVDESWVKI
jgi:hypothetical protein